MGMRTFGSMYGLSCIYDVASCEAKDCKGSSLGAELKLNPTGRFYEKWVLRHDGVEDLHGLLFPCSLSTQHGATQFFVPGTHCGFFLVTELDRYMELFVTNPDSGCFVWLECNCD